MRNFKFLFLFPIVASVLSLTSCSDEKYFPIKNVVWYSSQPNVSIYDHYGYIKIEDRLIEVEFWRKGSISFGAFEMNDDFIHCFDNDLLYGDIEYRNNTLIWTIRKDNVFDYKYETIVFEKRKMTEEDKEFLKQQQEKAKHLTFRN